MYEFDLDSVGISKVEHRAATIGYFPNFRPRDPAAIKPSCPRLQLLHRPGPEREMIETGARRPETLPFVARVRAQVEDLSAQAEDRHPADK